MNIDNSKIALLDLDNSLRDGWIIVDWAEQLSHDGLLASGTTSKLRAAIRHYQSGRLTYDTVAHSILRAFADGLRGSDTMAIQRHAREFIEHDPVGLRPFAYDLISALREREIFPLFVSGAPQEILDAAGAHCQLPNGCGTVFAVHAGIYSGTVAIDRALASSKQQVVDSLMKRTVSVELAVGDSTADLPLLMASKLAVVVDNDALAERVANSIPLNASSRDLTQILRRLDQ